MSNHIRAQFNKEIEAKKKEYGSRLTARMEPKEVIEIGAQWYEDVNTINEAYHMISDSTTPDDTNAYHVACDILDRMPIGNLFPQKKQKYTEVDMEKCKVRLSGLILDRVLEKRTVKILVFEPHHDDFMGSASSILYSNRDNVRTVVYTMTKSGDKRDKVDLTALHRKKEYPQEKGQRVCSM